MPSFLQESSLLKRISQEKEILEGTTKFLRAKVALQSAFDGGSSSEEKQGSQEPKSEEKGDSEQPPPAAGNPG